MKPLMLLSSSMSRMFILVFMVLLHALWAAFQCFLGRVKINSAPREWFLAVRVPWWGGNDGFADGQSDSHTLVGIGGMGGGMGSAVKEMVQHIFRNAHAVVPYGKGYAVGMLLHQKLNGRQTVGVDNGVFQRLMVTCSIKMASMGSRMKASGTRTLICALG